MRNLIKISAGFILVELIVSIVLLGIIGIFTSMFIYTGVKGYLIAKQTNEAAMKAQIALDRINLELRKINDLPPGSPPIANTSITYTSDDLPGTRTIVYDTSDPDNHTINIGVDGIPYVLLDHVETFNLSWEVADLNNSGDGNNEISGINISFTIADVGSPFAFRIYPRNWLPEP